MSKKNIQYPYEDFPLSNTEVLNVLRKRSDKLTDNDNNSSFLKTKEYLEKIVPKKDLIEKVRNLKYTGRLEADMKILVSYSNTLEDTLLSAEDLIKLQI